MPSKKMSRGSILRLIQNNFYYKTLIKILSKIKPYFYIDKINFLAIYHQISPIKGDIKRKRLIL
jgi:hypothetical protein